VYVVSSPECRPKSKHKRVNRSFENMSRVQIFKFKYSNQSSFQKEIKRSLNSSNACYHSVQNLLSSRLLSKNLKIRIYKTIIFPVVLHGCETWSLILMEKHRLRMFDNRVLRRVFRPSKNEVMGQWRKVQNAEIRDLFS
jgi:hypothetical protein